MSPSRSIPVILTPILLSLLAACTQPERAPLPAGEADAPGAAHLVVRTSKVGALDKSDAIELANLEITLREKGGGDSAIQSLPLSGCGPATGSQTFTGLRSRRSWQALARTADSRGRTIHTGSTTFQVDPGSTAQVTLRLDALFSMLEASVYPVRDSVTRVELWVDQVLRDDSAFAEQSALGDTIPLAFDYLATGASHSIRLDVRGDMWGRDTLLYRGDTILQVQAGQDAAHRMRLRWVGPGEPPAGEAAMQVTLGRVGMVTLGGELGDTAAAAFPLDSGLVAYYPFDGDADDASGHGNHGSVSGARYTAAGAFASALDFDGQDDFVEVADAPSLDLAGSFTLAAWIRPTLDQDPFERQIVSKTLSTGREVMHFGTSPTESTFTATSLAGKQRFSAGFRSGSHRRKYGQA